MVKLSPEMNTSSRLAKLIVHGVLVAASLVNMHNVLLIYTCFGSMFAASDFRPLMRSRLGL